MISISKRANIDVVIEPLDPLVQQAVSKIKMRFPSLLARVHKIVVHPGGGAELGHVQSGPENDPQEIHLYKGAIEEMVRRQTGASGIKPTSADYNKALEQAIIETVGHESGHIGPERSPEQLKTQPFLGEPQAETKAKETIKRIYPEALIHAALELDNIRQKFMPDHMGEPDLAFMVKASLNKNIIRDGLKILRKGSIPAIIALAEADEYNRRAVRQKDIARCLGVLTDEIGAIPSSPDFSFLLAKWQEKNSLDPTGKLDRPTMAKLRANMGSTIDFPRNFAKVTNNIYRGRQPDDINQLIALRDKLGIKRILSLNDDKPELADWCHQLGIQNIHAALTNGNPNDVGWRIFKPSISQFLLEIPIFIHCRHGADRTGGVVACFRTETGWPCDLAYFEAKSFGLKDRFPDIIDRFTSNCKHDIHNHKHPPIDTVAIRELLAQIKPIEQDILEPTPSDLHYTPGDSNGYDSGPETNLSPFSIRSIPVSPSSGR